MTCSHQILFYHHCGQTEDLVWLRPGKQATKLDASILPQIDATHAIDETDDTFSGNGIELHYQRKMCNYCDDSLKIHLSNQKPKKLDPVDIQSRCILWRGLVESFRGAQTQELREYLSAATLLDQKLLEIRTIQQNLKGRIARRDVALKGLKDQLKEAEVASRGLDPYPVQYYRNRIAQEHLHGRQ